MVVFAPSVFKILYLFITIMEISDSALKKMNQIDNYCDSKLLEISSILH